MKKKILYICLILIAMCTISIVFGYLIDYANSSWNFLTHIKTDETLQEIYNSSMFEQQHNVAVQYTVLCVLSGISICVCIALLVLVLKSDIGFIKDSFLERRAANKIKREEKQAQEQAARKTQRIVELEKELNELKKDGE